MLEAYLVQIVGKLAHSMASEMQGLNSAHWTTQATQEAQPGIGEGEGPSHIKQARQDPRQ
jgi:hypothetical protein